MNTTFKKYLAFLFLVLFLFPLIEKEIHTLEHVNDFHCTSKADKHLHSETHRCSVCDFTTLDSSTEQKNSFQFVLFFKQVEYKPTSVNVNIPCSFTNIPSRAPPYC